MLSTQHYRNKAGRKYYSCFMEASDSIYLWISRERAKKFIPYIEMSDTVLEYGVGTGWNLSKLTCAKKIGYDIGTHLQPIVSAHGIEFISDTKSIRDRSIDVIICHHVLEHVPDPSNTLTEIWRMLKPSGRMLLFIPFETQHRYRTYLPNEPNHHIFSWTPQTIGNLVHDCRFDIRSINLGCFGYDRTAAIYANRLKLGENGYRWLKSATSLVKPVKEIRLVAVPQR